MNNTNMAQESSVTTEPADTWLLNVVVAVFLLLSPVLIAFWFWGLMLFVQGKRAVWGS